MTTLKEIIEYINPPNYNCSGCYKLLNNYNLVSSIQNIQDNSIVLVRKKQTENQWNELQKNINNALFICKEMPPLTILLRDNFFIKSDNPRKTFSKIVERFFNKPISDNFKIGENCSFGNNFNWSGDVRLGNNVKIGNNVTLLNKVKIGDGTIIGNNVVIGDNGFSFDFNEYNFPKQVCHIGGVEIKEHCLIDNNTVIDRGVIDDTFIDHDVKIDNLCHVSHNVIIGPCTIIATCSEISGSVKIGFKNWISPKVSIKNKVKIGNENLIGIGSNVVKNISSKEVVVGNPAKPIGYFTGKSGLNEKWEKY